MRSRPGLGKSSLDLPADEELYTLGQNPNPKDSFFFYGSPLFRYRSQRSITHALDLLNHSEARYVEIYRRYNRLEKAYREPCRPAAGGRELYRPITWWLKKADIYFCLYHYCLKMINIWCIN